MTSATAGAVYEARPFLPSVDRASVVSTVLRGVAKYESLFTDYQRACEPVCADATQCARCASRIMRVSSILTDPKAYVWEVWKLDDEGTDVVGIVYLTDVVVGGDATAHYVFFDQDLHSKTKLLEQMIGWCFQDHPDEGWVALRRLTITVPEFAFALARHATRKLGFGGPYKYKSQRGALVDVEGVKQKAIPWRGENADLLVLGRLNGTVH
jgi:hypothetical protein